MILIRETRHAHREPFDFMSFTTLSLAIGALQMLPERGELNDWFSSMAIWVSATISGVAFAFYRLHRGRQPTARSPTAI
jgi:DHA2 family multidrug resistance protein